MLALGDVGKWAIYRKIYVKERILSMDFDDYQQAAHRTAVYPEGKALEYLSIKLAGESGEFCNKVGKVLRGDYFLVEEIKEPLIEELGDILWYVAELCTHLDVRMMSVAHKNITKLQGRKERGKIKGEGDNR